MKAPTVIIRFAREICVIVKYQDADSMAMPGIAGPEARIMAKEVKKKSTVLHVVGTVVIVALAISVGMYFFG